MRQAKGVVALQVALVLGHVKENSEQLNECVGQLGALEKRFEALETRTDEMGELQRKMRLTQV